MKEDAFYSWQPNTRMCKTSKNCTNPVPTDPLDPWRIHIERWPINGDPGDGQCGDGYIEGIRYGDGADCQSLCAANEDCDHYCYLYGGIDGDCRTFSGECGADGKVGPDPKIEATAYTCYDKPLPPTPAPTPTTTLTTGGVTTVPPTLGPTPVFTTPGVT